MMEFTLFSQRVPAGILVAQPAEKSTVHIDPLAVADVSEGEAKRAVDWLRHVWVPVALIEMRHGQVFVVEDWKRDVVATVLAEREKARQRDVGSVSD